MAYTNVIRLQQPIVGRTLNNVSRMLVVDIQALPSDILDLKTNAIELFLGRRSCQILMD